MNKAVFLDRDGTINVDRAYLYKLEEFRFEPGAVEGMKILQDEGYRIIIITGQSGIGRGYYSEEDFHNLMTHMQRELEERGIKIEGYLFCPHHPTKGIEKYRIDCSCRKPKTGMLEEATEKWSIDISISWAIGDKTADIKMANNFGIKSILVKTGKGGEDREHPDINPTYTADNLLGAARIIQNESS